MIKLIKKLYRKLFKKVTDDKILYKTKLYLLGNEAVCPVCSGCVKKSSTYVTWKCNDCGTLFVEIPEDSENDREIIVSYFKKE